MPRNLRSLPRTEVRIKLLAQLRHLLANPLQFRIGVFVAGQPPQIFHVLFQALDLALAARDCAASLLFFFDATSSPIPPQPLAGRRICRTASTSSGVARHSLLRLQQRHRAVRRLQFEDHRAHPGGVGEQLFQPIQSVFVIERPSISRTRNSVALPHARRDCPSLRASCSDSRVPASSTCTRTFSSSGAPGFSIASSRAKLSGNASNSCTPVMS